MSFNLNPYGSSFEFKNAKNPEKIQYFLWSVFNNDTDYFLPSKKDFMINFRVENIEKTLDYLHEVETEMSMKSRVIPMISLPIFWIQRVLQLS